MTLATAGQSLRRISGDHVKVLQVYQDLSQPQAEARLIIMDGAVLSCDRPIVAFPGRDTRGRRSPPSDGLNRSRLPSPSCERSGLLDVTGDSGETTA